MTVVFEIVAIILTFIMGFVAGVLVCFWGIYNLISM